MEIKISGTQKEIADLALALQNRLNTYEEVNPAVIAQNVMKSIRATNESESQIFDKIDDDFLRKLNQKAIERHSK